MQTLRRGTKSAQRPPRTPVAPSGSYPRGQGTAECSHSLTSEGSPRKAALPTYTSSSAGKTHPWVPPGHTRPVILISISPLQEKFHPVQTVLCIRTREGQEGLKKKIPFHGLGGLHSSASTPITSLRDFTPASFLAGSTPL